MKKALLIMLASLLLVVTGCSVAMAKEMTDDTPPKGDFNFIFKYGVTGGDTLDTYHGTFTKDMILAPSVTIDLVLSAAEMEVIYQKMVEIDFFNYPDEFKVNVTGDTIGMVTPSPRYYFKVEYASGIKELEWEDEITNPDVKADKLRELINLIKSIIEAKVEYQALPEPSGGYL